MTYSIQVKDDSTKERIIVLCPSAISVKEWLYTQLLRAMREDVAMNVTLKTMREIVSFYDTQLVRLDDFDADEMASGTFETYHGAIYEVNYHVEPFKIVNVI